MMLFNTNSSVCTLLTYSSLRRLLVDTWWAAAAAAAVVVVAHCNKQQGVSKAPACLPACSSFICFPLALATRISIYEMLCRSSPVGWRADPLINQSINQYSALCWTQHTVDISQSLGLRADRRVTGRGDRAAASPPEGWVPVVVEWDV